MKLKAVWADNFRCHHPKITLPLEDLTAVVGKNDAGKSAFFEAIRIFFGNTKPDRDDPCKTSGTSDIMIGCIFDNLPEKIVVDASHETSLEQEELLNQDGRLEIVQTWDCSLKTPKLKSVDALALTSDAAEIQDILSLTNAKLKALSKNIGIPSEDYNASINAEIRRALRASFADSTKSTKMVPLNKEGGKRIWEIMKSQLPTVAYFQADRPSTDQDSEAQDPLQGAVKRALEREGPRLSEIIDTVVHEADAVAKSTVEEIKAFNNELAGTLKPNISQGAWDKVFKTSITGDDEVPFNKRGSGVRRLILFSFYRAQQRYEREKGRSGSVIYLIEEPETGQHPSNQRLVVSALRELAEEGSSQVILSTHSPMLCRALPLTSLRYLKKTGLEREVVSDCTSAEVINQISTALGVLPDHNVKLFICVEGTNDESFFVNLSATLLDLGYQNIPNLAELREQGRVIFVPLGGNTLAQSVGRLQDLNIIEYHVYDRDTAPPAPAKYQDTIDAVNQMHGCSARCTNKRELENYVHPEAVQRAYATNGVHIVLPATFSDTDDVPEIVASAVFIASNPEGNWDQLTPENKKKKTSKAKRQLNNAAILLMNNEMFLEVDQYGEIREIFEEIKNYF